MLSPLTLVQFATMSPNQIDPELDQDNDGSSIATPITPPETISPDPTVDDRSGPPCYGASYPKSYSVPEPGLILVIRSVVSEDVITLYGGNVVLAPLGGFGSQFWECIKTDGWLGFRNVASGGMLGRDNKWLLCCSVKWHREHERFHISKVEPEGGYILLTAHRRKLCPVGLKEEKGEQKLAMLESGNTNGAIWEFLREGTYR